MGLVEDTKLGIFIYDLEMELDELDDALNNKKISFNEYSHNNTVDIEEDEEFNIN